MNILTIGYLHGAGGAERQIILLSNQLAQRCHQVTLCVLAENRSNFSISEHVNLIDCTDEKGPGFFRIIHRWKCLRKNIREIRPDVIVNYNLQSAYLCLTLSKEVRGKVVYSERGDPYDSEYSGLLKIIRDYTVAHMDGLVFQSEGARDYFPEKIWNKSIVIHNSVNIPQVKYSFPKEREKRIVSVGRLHPQKNQRMIIDAFASIANAFPEYSLDIYGDGPLHDELQFQIDQYGLSEKIRLNASRKDIFDCIYKASLFVLTSDYEGMPNALMEAMALGLPCISTDCRPGGARTLIESGVNGIIVPCNDIESLAFEMKRLLENRELAEALAINAKRLGETHTDEIVFEKWNSFLMSL